MKDKTIKYAKKPPRLTQKLIDAIRKKIPISHMPADCIIKTNSWLYDCPLCGDKDSVGVVIYNYRCPYARQMRQTTMYIGVSTCFGGRICAKCEEQLKKFRNSFGTLVTPAQRKHDRQYKKFLEHKLYPEIECLHKRADGNTAKTRLKTDSFYSR